jgi:hypothetical protein
MPKSHHLLFFLFLVITMLNSCQQEVNEGTENFDYIPTSPGSSWRYTSSRDGRFDLDATTRDTMIDGFKFRIFNRLNYTNGFIVKNYYSKANKTYRKYGTNGITRTVGDIILLKDTAIASTWTSPTGSTFVDLHEFKIAARDIQYTVNNVQFNNVIQLDYKWRQYDPNINMVVDKGLGKYYYARGVGLIESTAQGPFGPGMPPPMVYDTIRLYYYNVK